MIPRLDLIESRLKALFESTISLYPWGNRQQLLSQKLLEALHDSVALDATGDDPLPNVYTIYLNSQNLTYWKEKQGFLDNVARTIYEAEQDAGIEPMGTPMIQLEIDDRLSLDDLEIVASRSRTCAEETGVLILSEETKGTIDHRPQNAFLIIDGTRVIPLRQVVVNLGRRPDNHIILDDPRVSRTHAQLRSVRGRYILFDLNSTGGTFVNGQRISQFTLKPGDVISLAGVAIIYGEDQGPEPHGDTSSMSSGESSRTK
jgi:hypothetical protein